jgi:Asp-tRNA(Asn)/Glu-tRNA(Gln) amidotransferase B subunit
VQAGFACSLLTVLLESKLLLLLPQPQNTWAAIHMRAQASKALHTNTQMVQCKHFMFVMCRNAQERKMGMDGLAISPAALAEMISLIEGGTISGKIAKDVLPRLLDGEGNGGVKAFVEKEGLVQISGAHIMCLCLCRIMWKDVRSVVMCDLAGG